MKDHETSCVSATYETSRGYGLQSFSQVCHYSKDIAFDYDDVSNVHTDANVYLLTARPTVIPTFKSKLHLDCAVESI